jgi:amino acid adenylation domain-containing protein
MTFVEHQAPMREQSIPERFEEMVARFPDRLAIKCAGRSFSYTELDRASNRIARSLLTVENLGSGSVALLFDHGVNVIVAMMGALKAGKQVCVLDSRAPEVRMKFIIDDCRISAILTDTGWCDLAQKVFCNYRNVLNVDEIDQTISPAELGLPIAPSHTAFIAYTSGSTGQPRGVSRTHQERVARAISSGRFRNLCGDDRLSLLHSVAFGSGGADLFMALLNGVAVLPFDIASEGILNLVQWLKRERITVFHAPPAVFRELENVEYSPDHFTDLRLIRLSGAPITERDFELYKKKFTRGTLLEIGMGSTEVEAISNAVVNQDFFFPKEGSPIGYAREGREILILDDEGQEIPPGEVGEIAVRSREFTEDFGRQRDLSEGKFRRDPKVADALIYLTGDVGMRSNDGLVIHLGRKDFMVKIRGYRVELGGIERAIASHPDINDVGVVAWDRGLGEKYLVGYVVLRQQTALNVSILNDFLRTKIPDYMVPSTFIVLPALPLTNGKLDRSALPKPGNSRPKLTVAYVAPRNDVEKRLSNLWREVLSLDEVGMNDNFFDLGGHSLAASRVISRVIQTFQLELPVKALFDAPTVAEMAAVITEHQGKQLGEAELELMLGELELMSEEEAQRLVAKETVKG